MSDKEKSLSYTVYFYRTDDGTGIEIIRSAAPSSSQDQARSTNNLIDLDKSITSGEKKFSKRASGDAATKLTGKKIVGSEQELEKIEGQTKLTRKKIVGSEQELEKIEGQTKLTGKKIVGSEQELEKIEGQTKLTGKKIVGSEQELKKMEGQKKLLDTKIDRVFSISLFDSAFLPSTPIEIKDAIHFGSSYLASLEVHNKTVNSGRDWDLSEEVGVNQTKFKYWRPADGALAYTERADDLAVILRIFLLLKTTIYRDLLRRDLRKLDQQLKEIKGLKLWALASKLFKISHTHK
jgi:hypothetical protein